MKTINMVGLVLRCFEISFRIVWGSRYEFMPCICLLTFRKGSKYQYNEVSVSLYSSGIACYGLGQAPLIRDLDPRGSLKSVSSTECSVLE